MVCLLRDGLRRLKPRHHGHLRNGALDKPPSRAHGIKVVMVALRAPRRGMLYLELGLDCFIVRTTCCRVVVFSGALTDFMGIGGEDD